MPHEKHQMWKRRTCVERHDPFADVLSCSSALYARSPQFLLRHHDGGLPGKRAERGPNNHVIRLAWLVSIGNGHPEPLAGRVPSVTHHKRDTLACSSAQGRPQPAGVIFLAHQTPDLIQFENVITRCRQENILPLRPFLKRGRSPPRNRLSRKVKDALNSS
jgi:hypothetical protein